VKRAPEPGDIKWENLARDSKFWWIMRTVAVYAIMLALLIPVFLLIGKFPIPHLISRRTFRRKT
jgi:hypothetical protein